ncbi:MAG: TIGR01459 family HAD-type hydrolase [Hyphomicrobiaceae bacterium]|nr:TIGR01459 family HAD-type hydrolase [Hyphomicrobiaceae bacterium]
MISAPKGSRVPQVPIVSSISSLASGTDAWLVDIWGVMHNGVSPFPDAARACATFRKIGGTIMLLSNAPRPAASVVEQLQRIGVPDIAYDVILTSGDAARALIAEYAGKAVFHLGPDRDLALYEGTGVNLSELGAAAAIVCTGLFDDNTETPDDYADLLTSAYKLGLPMICANPDLMVERGGKKVWCAGGIAAAYEACGGAVAYAGKPYPPIYNLALEELSRLRGERVGIDRILAIGDGINTDIAGAGRAGIRSVFIASGVHVDGELDARGLDRLFAQASKRPAAAMTRLMW